MNTGNLAAFGLVKEARIYDNTTNILKKKSVTYYNDDTAYVSRRIIGLSSQSELYDGNEALMSKVTYGYDAGDFTDNNLQQNILPVQHDNANYGSSFITGRGNLTSTTRHDVLGQSSTVTSSIKYNIAGAVVAQTDPLGKTAKIIYQDKFNDGNNRNTYAFPSKVIDPAGNYSETKYRFDVGANVWANSPTPQGTTNSKGKVTERIYDSFGRLERETLVNHGGAYTRYEYASNGIQMRIYATLTTGAGEAVSERWTDGAGRTRYSRTEHPGSIGGWSGSKVEYDILGRVSRSTVPTEINPVTQTNPATWIPAGDDYRGLDNYGNPVWLWNSQEYDWQSRVTRKINTDGTDQLISYNGCGCSGGLETTIESELVPRDDQPPTNARRKQKVYADILGREYKSEVFDWSGNIYSTIVQTFNGRDQVTQITQYAGTENPNNTHQDTTLTYDGHGRLKTRHNPIENSLTYTSWIYNADDTVQQLIDPRGAITSYTYNDPRGLLTQISYDPPATQPTNATIPDTPTVNFTYDNAGNRISMSDGTGSTAYSYDELSRLKSETKTFTGLTGNFTISYDYELSGKLKSITDPFGATVNYNDDKAGRTASITGSGFANVSTYADTIKYRAFGAVKQLTYGSADNSTVSYEFDNRLRVTNYQATSSVLTGGFVRKASYEYFNNGNIKKANNLLNSSFDQSYKFDFTGRITENDFGMSTNSQNQQVKTYKQTIGYNAFGDMTSRNTTVWGHNNGFTATYANGRKQGSGLTFDALGNVVNETIDTYESDHKKFDVAGQIAEAVQKYRQGSPIITSKFVTTTIDNTFDGDGSLAKRVDTTVWRPSYPMNAPSTTYQKFEYFLRSSVLDKVITELDAQGEKKLTNVYTGKAVLAEQVKANSTTEEVLWKHEDINTGGYQKITANGQKAFPSDSPDRAELESLGGIVPQEEPYLDEEEIPANYKYGGNIDRPESGCMWDYTPIRCNQISTISNLFLNTTISVNERFEGGYGLYQRLQGSVSLWRYDIHRRDDIGGDKTKDIGDEIIVNSGLEYIGSFYAMFISPVVWNAAIFQIRDRVIEYEGAKITVVNDIYKDKLKESFLSRLKDPNCKKALDAVLKELDSDFSTIQDLYTDVEKNNGFLQSVKPFASYKNFPADEAPAQALGHFDKKGNRVVVFNSISRTDNLNTIGGKANAEANIRASYTVTLIHELFHVAKGKGGVSHKDIAKAMFDASLSLDGKTPVFKDNDGNDFSNPKKNKEENNSKYINAWINKYCPLPSK